MRIEFEAKIDPKRLQIQRHFGGFGPNLLIGAESDGIIELYDAVANPWMDTIPECKLGSAVKSSNITVVLHRINDTTSSLQLAASPRDDPTASYTFLHVAMPSRDFDQTAQLFAAGVKGIGVSFVLSDDQVTRLIEGYNQGTEGSLFQQAVEVKTFLLSLYFSQGQFMIAVED